jgi:YVTN family beta-propeller protein
VKKLAPAKTIDLGKGMRPMGTRMTADGKFLFISTGRSKMALVLDTATDKVVASVEAGDRPWGIGLSPDEKTLYTANGPSDDVSVIDIASHMVTKKIPVGHGPWGLAVVAAP